MRANSREANVEKKTRRSFLACGLLLAALGGLALGLAIARHAAAACRGGPEDRDLAALERELAAASGRIKKEIGGACDEAGGIAAGERSAIERDREAAGQARDLADGLGAIGTAAARTDGELDELTELVKELQRRSQGEGP